MGKTLATILFCYDLRLPSDLKLKVIDNARIIVEEAAKKLGGILAIVRQ